jgi:hypothetical protein
MKGVQSAYGTRVVVRTWPTLYPAPDGETSPLDVARQVLDLAGSNDWIRHVQINNEPNLEWPEQCAKCTWEGSARSYTWTNRDDPELYRAINEFYSDAWLELSDLKSTHADPTIRVRLQRMQLWAPPMADFYKTMSNGQNFYAPLATMIDLFDRMTYHPYPAPNYDSDGSGGVINNSWSWFSPWLQRNITRGTVRSMITEFGWNSGQMRICNTAQHTIWPRRGSCAASDGLRHTFDNDLDRFLRYHRHGAEVVAVWVLRGWQDSVDGVDRANALDEEGTPRPWFDNYRHWSR